MMDRFPTAATRPPMRLSSHRRAPATAGERNPGERRAGVCGETTRQAPVLSAREGDGDRWTVGWERRMGLVLVEEEVGSRRAGDADVVWAQAAWAAT